MLLPSPGPALVTTSERSPSSADENSTLVRTVLNASVKLRWNADAVQQRVRRCVLALGDGGNHAEERHAEIRLQLLRRPDPVVELLEEERQTDGEDQAEPEGDGDVALHVRRDRPARHFGGVDHADVAGSRSLEMPVSFVRCIRLS